MLSNYTNVVERIKSLQGSLTNTQLANNLKMTPQTVDLYMKQQRKPSVEFICNICSYFNVTSDWLLGLQTTNATVGGADDGDVTLDVNVGCASFIGLSSVLILVAAVGAGAILLKKKEE